MDKRITISIIVLGVLAAALAAFDASGLFPSGSTALKVSGIVAATVAAVIAALKGFSGGAACLLVLVLVLGASGCCTTARCYLARCETALEAADPIALKAMDAVCAPKVAACKGDPEKCEAFTKCRTAAIAYKASRKILSEGIATVNRALAEAGVE